MVSEGMGTDQALEVVHAAHPRADPNEGFVAQLRELSRMPCMADVSLPSLKELQAKALAAGVPQRDVAMTFDDEEGRQSLQQMTASAEQAVQASLQASAAVLGIRDPVQGICKQDPELRTSVAPVTLEFQKSWRTGYIEGITVSVNTPRLPIGCPWQFEVVRTLLLGTCDDNSPLRYLRAHDHLLEMIVSRLSELFLAVQPEHAFCKRHSRFETTHPLYRNEHVAETLSIQTRDNATAEVYTAVILKRLKEPIAHAKEMKYLPQTELEELDDLCQYKCQHDTD
jgi:hypothetical protein